MLELLQPFPGLIIFSFNLFQTLTTSTSTFPIFPTISTNIYVKVTYIIFPIPNYFYLISPTNFNEHHKWLHFNFNIAAIISVSKLTVCTRNDLNVWLMQILQVKRQQKSDAQMGGLWEERKCEVRH